MKDQLYSLYRNAKERMSWLRKMLLEAVESDVGCTNSMKTTPCVRTEVEDHEDCIVLDLTNYAQNCRNVQHSHKSVIYESGA